MYKKILVPLDGSELAECVLPHVEALTSRGGVKTVVFLRVVEPAYVPAGAYGPGLSPDSIIAIDAANKTAAEDYLSKLVKRTDYKGVKVQPVIIKGPSAAGIADYAEKNSVDLIAIATHGRSGVSRWAWGSVADKVMRSVCMPVLMVRAPGCVPGI
jgi:nucleotide-binding universal stress UspA family protein